MRQTFAGDIFNFENNQYTISTNNSCGGNIFLHDKYMIPYIFLIRLYFSKMKNKMPKKKEGNRMLLVNSLDDEITMGK